MRSIKKQDPQVYKATTGELKRQQEGMELIVSENYVLLQVQVCNLNFGVNKL
jgi:glycine/serine hydroxymethyltransferase